MVDQILSVRAICKCIKAGSNPVFRLGPLSFDIKKGEKVALLGPNGSGKTTTIRTLLGLTTADAGTVHFNQQNTTNDKLYLKNVSAVLEGSRNIYWRLSIRENMLYYARLRQANLKTISEKIETLIVALKLQDIIDKEVRMLSTGQKQKAVIACAAVSSPKFMLLDEPTLGLDVETSQELKKWVNLTAKNDDVGFLITSHDFGFIEDVCDRVIVMANGQVIFEGSLSDLKALATNSVILSLSLGENCYEKLSFLQNSGFPVEFDKERNVLKIETKNIDDSIDCLTKIKSTGAEIKELNVGQAKIEHLYLTLVHSSKGKNEKLHEHN